MTAKKAATVADLVEPYLAERLARHELTPLAVRNARTALRHFAQAVRDEPVSRLSREDVERWLAAQHKLAAATRRHRLSTIKGFCRWLVRRGYLRVDPSRRSLPYGFPATCPGRCPPTRSVGCWRRYRTLVRS